jgi:hypothetical protein
VWVCFNILLGLFFANSDPTPYLFQQTLYIGFCIELLLGSQYDGVFVHRHGVVAEVK